MTVTDLPTACAEAYAMYQKTDYKADFGWIDQIRHVREKDLIDKLDAVLVSALDTAVKGGGADGLHLAFPVIYDPEKTSQIRYKGFRSNLLFMDLDIACYFEALQERGKAEYTLDDLSSHAVHEVDDEGRDCGGKWKISDCLSFETAFGGTTYVLSGGRWYDIDPDLAKEVEEFFQKVPRVTLPAAEADENEEKYNLRLKESNADFLCLDRKLIVPTGASSTIEICDFLGRDKHLIHVKDKTSSSRLSHLFNQGTVSGRVLILDGAARDKVRQRISEVEKETGQTGFGDVICAADAAFRSQDFTIVYDVLATGDTPKLPFFSLVTFRHAITELKALGYQYAFAWVEKPSGEGVKKKKKVKDEELEELHAEAA